MKLSFITLYTDNAAKLAAFYQTALGLNKRFVHESGFYIEFETGTTVLAITQSELAKTLVPQGYRAAGPQELPANIQLGFEVADVPAALKKALEHGALPVTPCETKPWGWQAAMVRDIDGNLIELAKKV